MGRRKEDLNNPKEEALPRVRFTGQQPGEEGVEKTRNQGQVMLTMRTTGAAESNCGQCRAKTEGAYIIVDRRGYDRESKNHFRQEHQRPSPPFRKTGLTKGRKERRPKERCHKAGGRGQTYGN